NAGAMTTPGGRRGAVTLPNGNVLVMGGDAGIVPGTYPYTEIFELNTGTWSLVDLMNEPRSFFAAVLLNNNKVLAIGGARSKTAELYDPGVSNPSPMLSGVTPNTVSAGSGSTGVQLFGSNFLPNSIASQEDSRLVTTYLSSTTLLAYLPSSSLAVPPPLPLIVPN